MEKTFISVDHGNKQIKTPNFCFESAIKKFDFKQDIEIENDEMQVEYDGKYYVLQQNPPSVKKDKTIDEDYFILTLMAIAKELIYAEPQKEYYHADIVLATGLPPLHVASLKENWIKYFKDRSKQGVTYTFNDKKFNIRISEVDVYPQTYPALFVCPNAEEILEDNAILIDIGGWTTDVVSIVNGKRDKGNTYTLNYGVRELLQEVNEYLTNTNLSLITQDILERCIQGKTVHISDEAKAIINELSQRYAKELIGEIVSKNDAFASYANYFLGGGSILLKKVIDTDARINQQYHYFIEDIHANAKGYQYLSMAMR